MPFRLSVNLAHRLAIDLSLFQFFWRQLNLILVEIIFRRIISCLVILYKNRGTSSSESSSSACSNPTSTFFFFFRGGLDRVSLENLPRVCPTMMASPASSSFWRFLLATDFPPLSQHSLQKAVVDKEKSNMASFRAAKQLTLGCTVRETFGAAPGLVSQPTATFPKVSFAKALAEKRYSPAVAVSLLWSKTEDY